MISVIIPLYNKETIVARSVGSVLAQDFQDFEVVVVDDGSTDQSAAIVGSIADPRLRLISQPNGGPSKARNTGIREARGEWLLFLDADDELLPGALDHLHRLSQQHPDMDMLLGEVMVNDGKIRTLHTRYAEGEVKNIFRAHALGLLMQCSGSTLYRRTLCEQHPYDERIRRYEDLECLFRKYKHARLWLTHKAVAQVNCEFAAASRGRRDIKEDFMGYLDFTNKGFWERLSLYSLFLGEREHYARQARAIYPPLYKKRGMWLTYKLLHWLRLCPPLWRAYLRCCCHYKV